MALQRKKDGGPNVKFYETVETIAQFDSVRTWLYKNCKKFTQADPPTNKGLASLTVQLLQFQEETFGKQNTNPPLTKLPNRLFLDFKPGGSLCQIFAAVYKFKSEQGWRRFDFQLPSRMDRNVEMFMQIEKLLVSQKLLQLPSIYIRPDMDKILQPKLRDIIKRHQGVIADSEETATHIVYTLPSHPPPDEDFFRPVMKRDRNCMVHWWYYPESYDTWVTDASVDYDIESPTIKQRDSPWRVTARWLLDLEEFNEWMAEEDYLVDEEYDPETKRCKKSGLLRLTVDDMHENQDCDRQGKRQKKNPKRKRSPSPPPEKIKRKSSRTPGMNAMKKKGRWEEEEEDLTKDMEDPPSEPSIQEVQLAKQVEGTETAVSVQDIDTSCTSVTVTQPDLYVTDCETTPRCEAGLGASFTNTASSSRKELRKSFFSTKRKNTYNAESVSEESRLSIQFLKSQIEVNNLKKIKLATDSTTEREKGQTTAATLK